EGDVFLGRDLGHERDFSEEVASQIDDEVRALIEQGHDEAWEILVQYRDALDSMVLELVEKETLNKDDLERILAPVRKRPPHNSFAGFGKRTPSDRPPIEIPMSLRKPLSNGSPNGGSRNGGHPEEEGKALPGVVPAPNPPQPSSPGDGGVFGPQAGPVGQPYGSPPYDTPPGGE
ncbi:MAG TPA: hypothetical protein VHS54_12175, partial [Jatrophihabitans sp.]|nr:hypothetical protein [Jatrophihabitans sp.]